MGISFSTMLNRLKKDPTLIAYREQWDSDRYIYVGFGMNRRQVLYIHDGVHSDVYSVQQSDLFMNDWEVEHG